MKNLYLVAYNLVAGLALALVLMSNVMLTNGLRNGDFRRVLSLENDLKQANAKKTSSLGITKLSACKAQLDDGKVIDLSGLDNPSSPFQDKVEAYTYKFNPCSPITCSSGSTAAICQVGNPEEYNLGDQSSANFISYDAQSGLTIQFSAFTDEKRTSLLTCRCGSGNILKFNNEDPTLTYNMEFTSECCCPDKCKGGKKGGGGGGLTFGSILVIIFFSVLGAYLIGGILFMKFAKQKTGLDMIPNREMWSEMPGNVKAGFSFIKGKVTGGNGGYQPV